MSNAEPMCLAALAPLSWNSFRLLCLILRLLRWSDLKNNMVNVYGTFPGYSRMVSPQAAPRILDRLISR